MPSEPEDTAGAGWNGVGTQRQAAPVRLAQAEFSSGAVLPGMRPTWRGVVGVGRRVPSVALLPRPLATCVWVHGVAWEDEE